MNRCNWPGNDLLMIKYHDEEWGVPVHDDRLLFEYMILDAFQAGLSWRTVLYKRENFRKAFDNFNPKKIAKYGKIKYQNLLSDSGIIRNRAKINAAITNAQKFLEVQREFGSFDKYIWQFVGKKPIINKFKKLSDIPAKTRQSDEMSRDLTKRGFKFAGSTICYAFIQAAGLANDHLITCFRYKDLT
ncbi:MAG: DNA-3-methyladenine glycosylase I [Patescibacteria group bacterium]